MNIPLTTLDEAGWLDLVVDGADEFDPQMNLIKGAGGALLQEKLVATAADKMVVISDKSKQVECLGAFSLPVEVVRFGWQSTQRKIAEVLKEASVGGNEIVLRQSDGAPYVTDEQHYLLDLHLKKIDEPNVLAEQLKQIVGVVETGLFIDIAKTVIVGHSDGNADIMNLT